MNGIQFEILPLLAWRSIWRSKRRTIITVISIGFGLAIAIFTITMAEGGYYQMVRDATRMQAGHVTIEHEEYRDAPAIDLFIEADDEIRGRIDSLPEVETTKLLILGQGVSRSGAGTVGVAIIGIEPSVEVETSLIADKMVSGEYLNDDDVNMVVIGRLLADRLKLDIGKKLVLTTNDVDGSLISELCRVKGIFETGVGEIDGFLIQAPLKFTRELYGMPDGSATQLGIILKRPQDQKRVMQKVGLMVEKPSKVHPWEVVIPELTAFIKLDRGSNIIFQIILLGLILFTIYNTILMSVMERKREFGILLALGTPPAQLRWQVLLETSLLGILGVITGLLLGGLISYYFQIHGMDFSKFLEEGVSVSGFAMDTVIHNRVTAKILILLGLIVFFATLTLSLVPMKKASSVDIVDVLR